MLNDVKPPPPEEPDPEVAGQLGHGSRPRLAGVKPHEHIHPHIDPKEPGLHHSRIMGDRTPTDTIYAMPMEDRGSFFSTGLSIAVVVVVTAVLLALWLSLR